MKSNFKTGLLIAFASLAIVSCNNKNQETMENTKQELNAIFPKG